MTDEYIIQLIAKGETISIEFKSCTDSISSSIYETVCSFLNRDGGEILMGVNDDGKIPGVKEAIKLELMKVAQLIESKEGMRSFTISSQFSITQRTAERYLKILSENKVIEFRGAPKTGGYYIID